MSQIKASAVWKEIKPFAMRDINALTDDGKSNSSDEDYAIILYDESAQNLLLYSYSYTGLYSALLLADAGDIIFVPAGTLDLGGFYVPGDEISTGSITVNSSSGNIISGLSIGNLYCVEGYFAFRRWPAESEYYTNDISLSEDSGVTWEGKYGATYLYSDGSPSPLVTYEEELPSFCPFGEFWNTTFPRLYFQAIDTSIKIRVWDLPGAWGDNIGDFYWRLRSATTSATGGSVTVPAGVEIVGIGRNTVLDGDVICEGKMTNLTVTGAVSGEGEWLIYTSTGLLTTNKQIQSTVETGTAPIDVDSTTLNTNFNADLLDGLHANEIPPPDHDHSGDAGDGGTFDAANLTAGASTDGQVLTSDGAGGAAWEDYAMPDHDHSGDAGDGNTFDAANLTAGASTDGQVLTSDGAGGAAWEDAAAGTSVATDAIWDAKGDLAAGTGANTASKLTIGADGTYLRADSGEATGLEWTVLSDHDHSGDAGDGGTFDAANLTAGASTDGQVLTSDGAGGAAWEDPASGSGDVATDTIWDAKGDLAVGTGANTASKLTVGANGTYLRADSGETTGIEWGPIITWSGSTITDGIDQTNLSGATFTTCCVRFNTSVPIKLTQVLWDIYANDTYDLFLSVGYSTNVIVSLVSSQVVSTAPAEITFDLSSSPIVLSPGVYYLTLKSSNSVYYYYYNVETYYGTLLFYDETWFNGTVSNFLAPVKIVAYTGTWNLQ